MPDSTSETSNNNAAPAAPARSKDEIALELMKFVATATGYGKGATQVGFSGKNVKPPEEYADALIELFQRCRKVVNE